MSTAARTETKPTVPTIEKIKVKGEIQRRRQDFREGKAKEVPAEEALRRAEAAIG